MGYIILYQFHFVILASDVVYAILCARKPLLQPAALASTTLGGVRLLQDGPKNEGTRGGERKKGRREYQSFSRLIVVVSAYFRIFVQPCSVFFRHSKGLFRLGDFRFNR